MRYSIKDFAIGVTCLSLTAIASQLQAATLEPVGSGASFSTVQPSLALTPIIRTDGVYNDMGQVKWFAGSTWSVPRGYEVASGQLLPIAQHSALFSLLGTTFGGDGRTTFALPDLRGRAIVGAGRSVRPGTVYNTKDVTLSASNMPAHSHQTSDGLTSSSTGGTSAFENRQPGLALDYEVVYSGRYPSRDGGAGPADGTIGFVKIDAAQDASWDTDRNVYQANGQLLPISSNTSLFSLTGTTYGGDGRSSFGVPDTEGRIIVGSGDNPDPDISSRALGQKQGLVDTMLDLASLPAHSHHDPELGTNTDPAGRGAAVSNIQPELAMNYVIALDGTYPCDGCGTSYDAPFLGEVSLFSGSFAPGGWAFAHGQLLQISHFDALFSILGTTYGGDGRRTFALPDLRGRTAIGAGRSPWYGREIRLGETLGTEMLSLTAANLPRHSHEVDRVAVPPAVPLPASFAFLLAAFGMLGLARGRAT